MSQPQTQGSGINARDSASPTKSKPATAIQSRVQSSDLMDIDQPENSLEKLHKQELVPELFSLLHDLKTDKIQAKNFDNQAGGIRLKLNNIKQYLAEIPDITESVQERENRIDELQQSNAKKSELLSAFRNKIQGGDSESG